MIVANDPEIKGGTYYPITVIFINFLIEFLNIILIIKVKKHLRA